MNQMINQEAKTKFISVIADSMEDLAFKCSRLNDALEEKGYAFISMHNYIDEKTEKVHSVLIYKKAL